MSGGRLVHLVLDERNRIDLLELGESLHIGTGMMLRRDPETGAVTVHHPGSGEILDLEVTHPVLRGEPGTGAAR